MQANGLMDIFQSTYKKYHNTETALCRVHNNILLQLDKLNAVVLVLLHCSAAFDTINHAILLKRMAKHSGFKGTLIKLIKSYPSDHKQKVIDGDVSKFKDINYGVPKGSVLGLKF